jgi:hypothetical protein
VIDYTKREKWVPNVWEWLVSFPHADVGRALGRESGGNVSLLGELVEETVDQSGIHACIGDVLLRKGTEASAGVIN